MSSVLIVYGTTEGHTRKIATRVQEWIAQKGHSPTILDSAAVADDLDVSSLDAYVLAGSLHMSKHQASLVHFAKRHREALSRRPSLFLSVSLTAVLKDEEHQKAARDCIERFFEETGWRADSAHPIAGALLYTEYDFLKRMLMKMIARSEGGDTDTSKDHDYTNWAELEGLIEAFLSTLLAKV